MLQVIIDRSEFEYEAGELIKLFEAEFVFSGELPETGRALKLESFEDSGFIGCKGSYIQNAAVQQSHTEQIELADHIDSRTLKRESKILTKRCIFELLSKVYGTKPPWGILTGIRPTKIVQELLDSGMTEGDIMHNLEEKYRLSPEKASMATAIAITERKYIYPPDPCKIALYVSIPFCPTRCIYCSFPSNTLKQWGHLKAEYVKTLIYEIEQTAKIVSRWGKTLESVYIGGGTPTTLSSDELRELITAIRGSFDFSGVKEFTVEAGRVDTIDEDKLRALRELDIDRISINPQTMNDATLKRIGRKHTSADVEASFKMARDMGFSNINMDIILGLPGEKPSDVEATLERIAELSPESLTVHTMAIKRASNLRGELSEHSLADYEDMESMVDISAKYAKDMGLVPYYMYRQKYMLGNLENVGYAKPGCECIYNMNIMEEQQSIMAVGAGGISKLVYHDENRLERVPNVKDIQHYIARIDEMIKRKEEEVFKNAYTGTERH